MALAAAKEGEGGPRHMQDLERDSADLAADPERLERSTSAALLEDPLLQASHQQPAAFFAELLRRLRGQVPALRSRPGVGFDLFFDLCAARGGGGERAALRYYTREAGWESISYRELALAAARLAHRWQRAGAAPGGKVALLAGMGPELAVGLLAALKLGLTSILLPPGGATFLRERLRKSGCAFVATVPLYQQLLSAQPEWAGKLLPPISELGAGPELQSSHLYADDAAAFACFSPVRDPPDEPVAVPAGRAFLLAVRDALLGFRLRPGDAIACLGCDLLQYQPALLLAVFAAGATYVHLDERELSRDPRLVGLIANQPLRALILSAGGAELLGRGPRNPLSTVRALFCDAVQGLSAESWRTALAQLGELPPLYALSYDSAAGGSTLWSGTQPPRGPLALFPAPGVPFVLKPVSLLPAASPLSGTFLAATQPYAVACFAMLPAGLVPVAMLEPRRQGHAFPTAEVLAVVAQLDGGPGPNGAAVVALPPVGSALDSRFHLVVFTGSSPAQGLAKRIEEALLRELLPGHQPDAIVLLPLHARRTDGVVDAAWVRGQYLLGRLQAKTQDPMFKLLTELRDVSRRPAP